LIGNWRDRREAVFLYVLVLHRTSPLLAQSGRAGQRMARQLLGGERTLAAPQLAGFLACKASTAEDSFVD